MSNQALFVTNGANLLLGVIAFCLLFQRTWRRRLEYPREVYLLLLVLEAFVIALLVASAELLTLGIEERGVHVLAASGLITVVKGSLLYVLWTTRHTLFRTGTRRLSNNDEMRVNRDLEDHPHPYPQGGDPDGRTS